MSDRRVSHLRLTAYLCRKVEATSGFEPLHRGFADLPLNHLGTSPREVAGRGPAPGRSPGWLPLEDSNLG
jgi:hypothetical protein